MRAERKHTLADRSCIVVYEWKADQPKAVVFLVHGLGEHAGRYDHVAERLNSWGFAVRSYDQYGHGESDKKKLQ